MKSSYKHLVEVSPVRISYPLDAHRLNWFRISFMTTMHDCELRETGEFEPHAAPQLDLKLLFVISAWTESTNGLMQSIAQESPAVITETRFAPSVGIEPVPQGVVLRQANRPTESDK
jgi:hypothetical protein